MGNAWGKKFRSLFLKVRNIHHLDMSLTQISIATSIQDMTDCYPVIQELRSHLELPAFIAQVQRQQQQFGYQLVSLTVAGSIESVAGFRVSESLAWGKFLYVDDLIVRSDTRSQGYGGELFNWLTDYARSQNCQQLTLDSGVQRFAAHRFYLNHRMEITSHHFTLKLWPRIIAAVLVVGELPCEPNYCECCGVTRLEKSRLNLIILTSKDVRLISVRHLIVYK